MRGRVSCRILVVDDDQPTREALEAILGRAGYHVTPLASGEGLEEHLENSGFTVAVMDYHLPTRNGVELAGAVKERLPACRVVLISSEASRWRGDARLPAVVDRFLAKPFSKSDILQVISELCPPH
jgi:DNA-binding NtrC family response regulator